MNDSEQNFEDLKQLLKLKRYEIPPPGYFNNFSGQVISAIREERTGSVASRVNSQTSWLVRFLSIFDSRPGLVGGLATSLMLLLVFGVVLADHSDSDLGGQNVFAPQIPQASASAQNSPLASATLASDMAGTDSGSTGITVSTNPLTSLQPATGLFGQPNPLFENASFSLAGSPPAH
jgi:hypothetical protein